MGTNITSTVTENYYAQGAEALLIVQS